ncbi:MAG TPA: hypothetical protein VLL08_10260 [Kineosporiaceae bacterium]|nr:hypothetical protein [Kineosporiaceae bacterium]
MNRDSATAGPDDRGAALVLALLFITGVGLITGALLTFSSASIRSATELHNRSQVDLDVDGALQVALNSVRQSTYNNAAGETCLNGGSLDMAGTNSALVRVTCTPGSGTGAAAGLVPISSANRPGSAILTLGTNPGEPGIGQSSNGVLWVKGRMFSNSTITQGGSGCPDTPQPPTGNCAEIYSPNAKVIAKGNCQGTIFSVPAKECNATGADPSGRDLDPGTVAGTAAAYAQPPTALSDLNLRTVPTTCPDSTVTLQAGYYDDAVALSTLSACGKTIIFAPGTYYFDFHNAEMAATGTTAVPKASDVWTVNNKDSYLIGGTPSGWTTGPPPTFPGACVSPLTTTTAAGVQFVFGGDSRMVVTAGKVELCGSYFSSKPSLVIYGAKTGADTTNGPFTSTPSGTSSTPTGATGYATIPAGQVVTNVSAIGDSRVATAVITRASGSAAKGGVVLPGYAPTPTIPAGSILTSAQVLVAHQESILRNDDEAEISLTAARTGATPATRQITTSSSMVTETQDWTDALASEVHRYGLTGLRLQFDVTAAARNGGNTSLTSVLDGAVVRLTWKPPAVRGERTAINGAANCIGNAPYLASGTNCALITTSGNQTQIYLQGTVYSPFAALDIAMTNASGQVFKSGLITRSLLFKVTASSNFNQPVIEIPDNSLGATPLDVYLTAYACPTGSAASCAAATPPAAPWRVAGQAAATITDTGSTPVSGSREITVRSWQLPR